MREARASSTVDSICFVIKVKILAKESEKNSLNFFVSLRTKEYLNEVFKRIIVWLKKKKIEPTAAPMMGARIL